MPVHLGTSDWEDERNKNAPPCPDCGSPMRIKAGPLGEFYSCSRFPDCRGKRMLNADTGELENSEDVVQRYIKELYGE